MKSRRAGDSEPFLDERAQREGVGRQRLAMDGVRIAIGRELQRVEAKRLGALDSVAGQAVAGRRDAVAAGWARAPRHLVHRDRMPAPRRSARRSRRSSTVTHRDAVAFHNNRVSTLRPAKLNSFQNRVPTGNSHAASSATSIVVPGGRNTHRVLVAPSDHSGYCGENGRLRLSTTFICPGTYRPVSLSRAGACGSPSPAADQTRTRPLAARRSRRSSSALRSPHDAS